MNRKVHTQLVIIAAGAGKRLQPLVTPKAAFPFLGKPYILHVLENLAPLPREKTIVVVSPDVAELLEETLKNIGVRVVVQKAATGMADAVIAAEKSLDKTMPTLITNLAIQDQNLVRDMVLAIKNDPNTAIMSSTKVSLYKPGGYLVLSNKKVCGVVEKPGADHMPSDLYKLVFDYFPSTEKLLAAIRTAQSKSDDVYEVAVNGLLESEGAIHIESSNRHPSFKYVPSVLDVMSGLLTRAGAKQSPHATIAKTAIVDGDVIIEEGAKVLDFAAIKGPAYIGKNVVVGNGALVRESAVEEGCEIGYNTEVARSYIGPKTKCHTSYIGDSIIEGGSNLAAGTITANLRFDEQNIQVKLPSGTYDTGRRKFGAIIAKGAKTGIHASLMPGTVVNPGELWNK